MRLLVALGVLSSCYEPSSVQPCTVTCDAVTACPGELVCGADSLCHAPGATLCSLTDAGPGDGSGFTISDCPSTYDVVLASTQATSRYRVVFSVNPFWEHETACSSHLPGATHLLIPDSVQELDELVLAYSGINFYVGAVQDPTMTSPSAGWIRLDGAVNLVGWSLDQPDDENDNEEDHNSQIAYVSSVAAGGRLFDASGLVNFRAVCECDGRPISAMARSYIDADPNNPN